MLTNFLVKWFYIHLQKRNYPIDDLLHTILNNNDKETHVVWLGKYKDSQIIKRIINVKKDCL